MYKLKCGECNKVWMSADEHESCKECGSEKTEILKQIIVS